MNRLLCLVTLAGALLGAGEAHAQFENRSLRLTAGYLDLQEAAGLSWGIPIGLGYTGYIESGWEWTFDVQGMLLTEPIAQQQLFGVAGGPGLRYLFFEEAFRPYLGADLSYLHLFHTVGATNYVGLGPKLGFDYFVADSVSLGLQAQANFYWMLNTRLQTSLGLQGVVGAWF